MPGPQPVPSKVEKIDAVAHSRPLEGVGSGALADRAFYFAMLACGLSVLALVGVIIYQLATKSALTWHAFGWKFFFDSDWDPVNELYGAWPFVYGTLVSSFLALLIAVPLGVGVAVFITEMSPTWLRVAAGLYDGITGGHPERDLRAVGYFRPGSYFAARR